LSLLGCAAIIIPLGWVADAAETVEAEADAAEAGKAGGGG